MNHQKFFKNLSWLWVLNLLVKPVWIFGIDRQVQNLVGHEEYGNYFALLNLSYLLSFLADAGITNRLNVHLASNQSTDLRRMFYLKVCLLALYVFVVVFAGWLFNISRWDLLMPVIIIQALTSLLLFLRSIITAHQLFKVDSWLSVLDKLVLIVVAGGIIYTPLYANGFSLPLFLYLQVGSLGLVVAISYIFIRKQNVAIRERESFLSILTQSFPFVLLILLMTIHSRLDGFLLEQMHPNGAFETGKYAAAYRLLDAGNMVGYLAASFLVPFAAKNFTNKKLLAITATSIRQVLLTGALVVVMFLWNYAGAVQELLYHTSDEELSTILALTLTVLPALYLTHIYGSLLTAAYRLKSFATIVSASVLINVAINIWLIPTYGAMACSIAALVSQYICAFACFIAVRQLQIQVKAVSIIYLLLAGLLLFGFFRWTKELQLNEWVSLLVAGLAATLIMFAWLKKSNRSFLLPD